MSVMQKDYPALSRSDLRNAQLYANRNDLIMKLLASAKGGKVAELGVALGTFSSFLIDALQPVQFVAFDLFSLHEIPVLWGQKTSDLFGARSHLQYFKDSMLKYGPVVVVEQGLSHERLAAYPDGHFDLIYVDAGHDYESVKQDSDVASRKLTRDGLMVFNDYVMYDHIQQGIYGVVPAVNEMVASKDWKVVGFALQHQMFCDIALRRSQS